MKRWQQYGIAISVAWALGVASYVRYQELPRAEEYATHAYYLCSERVARSGNHDNDPCLQNVGRDWDEWMNRQWGRIACIALLPIAAGWLVAFAGIFAYRRARPDQAK